MALQISAEEAGRLLPGLANKPIAAEKFLANWPAGVNIAQKPLWARDLAAHHFLLSSAGTKLRGFCANTNS